MSGFFFLIEREKNKKTSANVTFFLATGFEFGYDVTALYFSNLKKCPIICGHNLKILDIVFVRVNGGPGFKVV